MSNLLQRQNLPNPDEWRLTISGNCYSLTLYFRVEMATHSGILAWKIPGTEEPGRLQSMGLQRAGHD